MKISKLALLAALVAGGSASATESRRAYYQSSEDTSQVVQVSHCECGEPVCGCEATEEEACDSAEPACGAEASCGTEAPSCGCESASCDCGGGREFGACLDECCDLGDAWTLFGEHCGWSAGGWASIGGHSAADRLFNTRPDEIQLHQAWLFAQKAIDTTNGFDLGGRIDYVYGTDGPNTQAFGTDPRGWDNSWDHGRDYGHAIPQLYGEVGYGDLSVKVGHFYTIIGWEVVQATGNFFYSHAYTFNNSEPFTHTGTLATYSLSDDVSVWGGYVMGWDSGFDDNGDAFLGGVSAQMTDKLKLIYASVGGRFDEARFPGSTLARGYMHSVIADYAVTDSLQYIFQSDLLTTENDLGDGVAETIGINQYLIYTLNDCWSLGGRFEWYQSEGIYSDFGTTSDIYALTAGVNYRPHANVLVRPEIRWDWVDDVNALNTEVLEDGDDNQFSFGMDTVFTF